MRLTLDVGTHIDAPFSRVWRLLTDTQTWTHWGPSVREVDSTERFIRAGLTGRIRTPFGVWVPFIIDTFEPEHYWDWRVGGVAATGHRVDPRGPDQCRLTFTVPVWAAGYTVVCRVALNRIKRLLTSSIKEDRS
jgi:uncharacterized protein YndB with AHSA1/START domain